MPRIEPERLHVEPTIVFATDNGVVKLTTFLWGPATAERVEVEQAIHHYRLDQLMPQPKIEFERDEEDMDV